MVGDLQEDIACVVIGRNEGERLTRCLRSVLEVSSQVVYADSASSDGSVGRARELGVIAVILDPAQPLNAARGRNVGFEEALSHFPNARFVQFLDGDCILSPEWVETGRAFLEEHPRAAIACGRRYEAHPNASFYNRFADEEWDTPVGQAEACGGDALMRVEALVEVGGFNPALMASEEPELAARLRARGWEIWRLDAPMTEHDAAIFRFGQWWKRTTRTGYGYAQAWQATRNLPQAVNARKLRSASLWVVVVPVTILLLAIGSGIFALLLAIPLIYAAQVARIALRRRDRSFYVWRASAMVMLAKVPELIGAARALLGSRKGQMIEYKRSAGSNT